jgi:hypothetical protein
VSLHSIVSDGLAGRLHLPRQARAVAAAPRQARDLSVLLTGTSMRILETGLAVAAIAAALVLGLAR